MSFPEKNKRNFKKCRLNLQIKTFGNYRGLNVLYFQKDEYWILSLLQWLLEIQQRKVTFLCPTYTDLQYVRQKIIQWNTQERTPIPKGDYSIYSVHPLLHGPAWWLNYNKKKKNYNLIISWSSCTNRRWAERQIRAALWRTCLLCMCAGLWCSSLNWACRRLVWVTHWRTTYHFNSDLGLVIFTHQA